MVQILEDMLDELEELLGTRVDLVNAVLRE